MEPFFFIIIISFYLKKGERKKEKKKDRKKREREKEREKKKRSMSRDLKVVICAILKNG